MEVPVNVSLLDKEVKTRDLTGKCGFLSFLLIFLTVSKI